MFSEVRDNVGENIRQVYLTFSKTTWIIKWTGFQNVYHNIDRKRHINRNITYVKRYKDTLDRQIVKVIVITEGYSDHERSKRLG